MSKCAAGDHSRQLLLAAADVRDTAQQGSLIRTRPCHNADVKSLLNSMRGICSSKKELLTVVTTSVVACQLLPYNTWMLGFINTYQGDHRCGVVQGRRPQDLDEHDTVDYFHQPYM